MCGRIVEAVDRSVYAMFSGVTEVVTEALSDNIAQKDPVHAAAEHGAQQLGSFRGEPVSGDRPGRPRSTTASGS